MSENETSNEGAARPAVPSTDWLADWERAVEARIAEWTRRLEGPHDKGVHQDEEAYRTYLRGRLYEAQALREAMLEAKRGSDIRWATPQSANDKAHAQNPAQSNL